MTRHNRSSLFLAGVLACAFVAFFYLVAASRAAGAPQASRYLVPPPIEAVRLPPVAMPPLLAPLPALSKAALIATLERSVANARLSWSLALYTGGPDSAAARYFDGREEAFALALSLARQLPDPAPLAAPAVLRR